MEAPRDLAVLMGELEHLQRQRSIEPGLTQAEAGRLDELEVAYQQALSVIPLPVQPDLVSVGRN